MTILEIIANMKILIKVMYKKYRNEKYITEEIIIDLEYLIKELKKKVNDEKLSKKARYLSTQAKDDPARYIHHEIGYNFRLTNIQAALGVAQLEQLPGFLKQKKGIPPKSEKVYPLPL